MTTTGSQFTDINITCGVQPPTDRTPNSTTHYTAAYGIRSVTGQPEKIGGNAIFNFSYDEEILGTARTVFSADANNLIQTVVGTDKRLYSVQGQILTNITPLETTTNAIANSIATHYATLANNPINTVIGTGDLVIDDTEAALFQAGDNYKLSGATTTNGIADTLINATHIVRAIGTNTITVTVAGTASSSGVGGGAAIERTSGLLTFTAAAHGQANGDRAKITLAANTGGILAAAINLEFAIRNIQVNSFDVLTASFATSSVSAAGGAATLYQKQIAAGELDERAGQGYGMGLYGLGLYGTALLSSGARTLPRIWFADRFADTIIMTAGNQTGVYEWAGDSTIAPTLLANAPTAVNYSFVSDNIVVTFGAGGVPNKIFSSAQGDPTNWTASSTNVVYEDNIEGAGRLISHVQVNGLNLIFTNNEIYTFRFIGGNEVWKIDLLEGSTGIIAPMARCSVKGVAFWMASNNFYMWDGGVVKIIPANSQPQTTLKNFVFNNLNESQRSKVFAWYNALFDEVWFHIPSATSNEPDTVARVSLQDFSWWPDVMERTAAEYPNTLLFYPRLMSPPTSAGLPAYMRYHELGNDDDAQPLAWSLSSPFQSTGRTTANAVTFIPDSTQVGNINLNVKSKLYPQSANNAFNRNFTVTPTTEKVESQINGRYFQATWSGNALGQSWQMGAWQSDLQMGSPL